VGAYCSEAVAAVAIPANTPALVREVLEDLRDTYGSETVFLCGRVDLDARSTAGCAEEAGGLYSAELLVCWMGNVTAQLLAGVSSRAGASPHPYENQIPIPERTSPAPTGECVTLGGDDDRVARWSTLRGARGHVSVWKGHLDAVERLIVHTDGLDAIASSLHHLDDEAWLAQTQRLLLLPRNDDMTALELRWHFRDSGVLNVKELSENA
jgi:hypothetical protein